MKAYLQKLFAGDTLTQAEAREAMAIFMRGEALPEQMAGFLGAIAARGETRAELVGCVETMRSQALRCPIQRTDLIDVCGTGGDGADTFNISTTNALLLAALGLGVAKHGNRAVSSQSGSADVLEQLGLKLETDPAAIARTIENKGFGFLFAPSFHPAMKHVAPVRKALGVRTLFNLLGPLANPAPVKRQVLGVYDPSLLVLMAEALLDLGIEEALVVWGEDGLDELSLSTSTQTVHVKQGKLDIKTLRPEDFGLRPAPLSALKGGSSQENARICEGILNGEKGPRRDVVLMNASAALVIAGRAQDWKDGVQQAAAAIDDGRAAQKLRDLREAS